MLHLHVQSTRASDDLPHKYFVSEMNEQKPKENEISELEPHVLNAGQYPLSYLPAFP